MPDDLIRELPRIRRYLRHNEAEDGRFATFIKTRLGLPGSELDAVVREVADSVWSGIDCLTCGNCCKSLQIVVDDGDIARLSIRLGTTAGEFKRKYVARAPDGAQHFKSAPCPFLGEGNACTLYDDRPQACRDFPYLHAGNFKERTLVTWENAAMCPIAFNVWQRLKVRLWKHKKP